MGTVVFPEADAKIFLDASAEERANRRYKQLVAKGVEADYDKILNEIKERDNRDRNRAVAPLKAAPDALELDSTHLSIEEVVEKARMDVNKSVHEAGINAAFKLGLPRINKELLDYVGRLKYRTSYGQNALDHCLQVAYLSGIMAAELGLDQNLAKRAGLLHDIGKAVDHEVEGSHVEIGVQLATKYREPKEVIDAIASHHGDKEPESIIAVLVAAADAVSSARPGARSDSLENYVKRLEALEQISNAVPGVESSYAIQAGREIRVMVKPEEIDDLSTFTVARKIKEEIEDKLSYPGTIKVTVIRETRAVDVAK